MIWRSFLHSSRTIAWSALFCWAEIKGPRINSGAKMKSRSRQIIYAASNCMLLQTYRAAFCGSFLPSAWPTRTLIPCETPMEGIKARELIEITMFVAANSSLPIRPTIRTKRVKAKISRVNWSDPGIPNRINPANILRSNWYAEKTPKRWSFLRVKIKRARQTTSITHALTVAMAAPFMPSSGKIP